MGVRRGAYGFALEGLEDGDWLVEAKDDWETVTVRREVGRSEELEPAPEGVFRVRLMEQGAVDIHPVDNWIRFVTPKPLSDAALIHPYLAPAATVLAAHRDWNAFHAGAFVAESSAWVVTAERHGGKSTTLAALDQHGYPVLADDLVVVRDGSVLSGPRSIDLRGSKGFPNVEDLGRVGDRNRWRARLGPVASEVPLGGYVLLDWSDDPSVTKLDTSERAEVLAEAGSWPLSPMGLLQAMALPMWSIKRPPGEFKDTVAMIEEAVFGQ